jgi:hypothetical protein
VDARRNRLTRRHADHSLAPNSPRTGEEQVRPPDENLSTQSSPVLPLRAAAPSGRSLYRGGSGCSPRDLRGLVVPDEVEDGVPQRPRWWILQRDRDRLPGLRVLEVDAAWIDARRVDAPDDEPSPAVYHRVAYIHCRSTRGGEASVSPSISSLREGRYRLPPSAVTALPVAPPWRSSRAAPASRGGRRSALRSAPASHRRPGRPCRRAPVRAPGRP